MRWPALRSFGNKTLPNYDVFVFRFALIDILFLPYFWLISAPLSLPFILHWSAKNIRYIFSGRDGNLLKIIFITMVNSFIIGMVFYPEYFYDNIKIGVIFLYCFGAYCLFKKVLSIYELDLKFLFNLFSIFLGIILLTYYTNKNFYSALTYFWNLRSGGAIAGLYENFVGYRFSFIWTDPNNIAYMISSIFIFLISYYRISIWMALWWFVLVIATMLASASRGGAIAFGGTLILYLIVVIIGRILIGGVIRIRIQWVIGVCVLILICILGWVIYDSRVIDIVANSNVFAYAQERLGSEEDTRLEKWKSYYRGLEPWDWIFLVFAGRGAGSIFNGQSVSPHNGHIFWIFNYGLISLIAFLMLTFHLWSRIGLRRRLWMLPFFVGFTLNIMIGEVKLFAIYLLMLAYATRVRNTLG